MSWFTHVTTVPDFTVSAGGSNAKFLIVTVAPPPLEGCVDAGTCGAVEEEQPAAMQARTRRAVHAKPNIRREYAGIVRYFPAGV